MTGTGDAAAAEAAQLEALRQGAEQRRKELGDTLEALTAKLAEDLDVGSWARRGAYRATAGLGRATAAAARRALPGPDSAAAAAGALQRATGSRRTRAVLAAGSAGLLLAGTAWWALSRRAHQRETMPRRGLRAARWAVPAAATAREARRRARRGR